MSAAPLSPAQHRKLRLLSAPREHDAAEAGGEINVVPFLDIIVNVLMFVLATLPALFGSTITSTAGSKGEHSRTPKDHQRLPLTIIITAEGVSMKTEAGQVGPGCGAGVGITIPKRDGAYDWAALTACATTLKRATDDPGAHTSAQIIAEPGVDYQTLVTATDALRQTDDASAEPLFPDVSFGVVR